MLFCAALYIHPRRFYLLRIVYRCFMGFHALREEWGCDMGKGHRDQSILRYSPSRCFRLHNSGSAGDITHRQGNLPHIAIIAIAAAAFVDGNPLALMENLVVSN